MCLCHDVVRAGQVRLPHHRQSQELLRLRRCGRVFMALFVSMTHSYAYHQGRDLLVLQRSLVLRPCNLHGLT